MSRTKWYRLQKKAREERPHYVAPKLRLVHRSERPRRLAWVAPCRCPRRESRAGAHFSARTGRLMWDVWDNRVRNRDNRVRNTFLFPSDKTVPTEAKRSCDEPC
jgi:hypothetical protein